MRQFSELVNMWIEDEDYSPEYDAAVRDWARRSSEVARAVHMVDIVVKSSNHFVAGFGEIAGRVLHVSADPTATRPRAPGVRASDRDGSL